MDLKNFWEKQGYKKFVERLFDQIRVETLKGQALITQGSGAYWQLLIPSKGVVQVNLLDEEGTLGVYVVPDEQIPGYIRSSHEPDLTNITGIKPTTCTKINLEKVLSDEVSSLLKGEKMSPRRTTSTPQWNNNFKDVLDSLEGESLMGFYEATNIVGLLIKADDSGPLVRQLFRRRPKRDIVTLLATLPGFAQNLAKQNISAQKNIIGKANQVLQNFQKERWVMEIYKYGNPDAIDAMLSEYFEKSGNDMVEFMFIQSHPEMTSMATDLSLATYAIRAFLANDDNAVKYFMAIRRGLAALE